MTTVLDAFGLDGTRCDRHEPAINGSASPWRGDTEAGAQLALCALRPACPPQAAYSVSKGGLTGLSRNLGADPNAAARRALSRPGEVVWADAIAGPHLGLGLA